MAGGGLRCGEPVGSVHLTPIQAARQGLPQAAHLPTPKLKWTPKSHPTPPALPGQPLAGTHKSVKSSRVSLGVNTSSSPITWGGGQSTRWAGDTDTAEGTPCSGQERPRQLSWSPPTAHRALLCPLAAQPCPGTHAHKQGLFLDGDSRDPLGEGQPQVWVSSQPSKELQPLGPSSPSSYPH